jgi:hypothetical protein
MTVDRRQLLSFAIGVVVPLAAPDHGRAQTYPERPVRVIVGFPAGGQIDIIARLIGQWLSDRYTLFLANGTNAVNATLYDNLRFDFVRDTAPIASINRIPLVFLSG